MPGIVIHPLKAVYWPIPKNGSTMLKRHFANLLGVNVPINGPIHFANFEMTEDGISEYENFTFVRNPYLRLYSLWCDKADGARELDPNVFGGLENIILPNMPFIDFAYTIFFQNKRQDPHWLPQVTQVPDTCTVFKIEESPLRFLFQKENHRTKGRWQTAYNAALLEFVYEYYKKDFIRFGYAK